MGLRTIGNSKNTDQLPKCKYCNPKHGKLTLSSFCCAEELFLNSAQESKLASTPALHCLACNLSPRPLSLELISNTEVK